jgi:histone H3/H4
MLVTFIVQQKREEDFGKIDKIAAAISAKASAGSKSVVLPYTVEESAKALLLDHMTETVSAAIEGAKTLAQHRGEKSISVIDIQLILGDLNCIHLGLEVHINAPTVELIMLCCLFS